MVSVRRAMDSPSVIPFALGALSSSPTTSSALASLQKERLRHHLHGLNPQWVTVPTAGHDRGLHQGVPHGLKQRRGLRPPLSQESRRGGFGCSRHNPTVAVRRTGHLVYDDGSTAGAGTAAAHQPLLRAMAHSSGGATSTFPHLATQRQAGDDAATEQARRQANHGRGSTARSTIT
jgi:hypothetical protein